MKNKTEYELLLEKCVGNWDEIIPLLAPELAPVIEKGNKHGPCPSHGGKDGMRCFDDFYETGGIICNTCGAFPNGILAIAHNNGWSKNKTIKVIKKVLKYLDSNVVLKPSPYVPVTPVIDQKKEKIIKQILDECIPINHPNAGPIQRYFEKRGLEVSGLYPGILYHPSLPYYEEGTFYGYFPAMIGKVMKEGKLVTLHRTYLTKEGHKAPVPSPKKLLPPPMPGMTKGGAVHLFSGPYLELGLAEGIETAIAVQGLKDIPMWATLSANSLREVIVPPDVKHILIFADKDRSGTGEKAAELLKARLRKEGRGVEILVPDDPIPEGSKGIDWADVITGAYK